MNKKISKTEVLNQINEFFQNIKEKIPKEIKKIKKLAMNHNIHLKEKRKLFCKKCFFPYKNSKIRIKNKIKSISCENCKNIARWKIK